MQERLLEEIISRDNMQSAFKRVIENKGAWGIDVVEGKDFSAQLMTEWSRIKDS